MKRTKGETKKLLEHAPGDTRWGPLLGVLSTTFEFDPHFYETDLLPSVLRLGSWDGTGWQSRVALEQALADLEGAWVAVDQRRYRGRPRSWRVEVRPAIGSAGATLHAKVTVVVYESAVRVQLGSANLTPSGYRENREVMFSFVALPTAPELVSLARQVLSGMPERLRAWWSPTAQRVHALASSRLSAWPSRPSSARVAWSDASNPLVKQVLDAWEPGAPLQRIVIVSPFWSGEGDDGPLRELVGGLRQRAKVPSRLEVLLLTEAVPEDDEWRPNVPRLGAFDPAELGITLSAQAVLPTPTDEVKEDVIKRRALHAKVVLLEGPKRSVAYCGSANFTARGWGFGAAKANIEAGLIITDSTATLRATVLPPASGPVIELHRGNLPPAEPLDENDEAVPTFIRGAWLVEDPKDGARLKLRLEVDGAAIHGSWSASTTAGSLLHQGAAGEPNLVDLTLTAEVFEALLRTHELVVRWWSCVEGARYPVNMELAARASLPAVVGSGKPDESALLAYYQKRIRFDQLFPPPPDWDDDESRSKPTPREKEPSVDTSQIQSYQVREFVEALQGVIEDLSEAAKTSDAAMERAVMGPVSPVALAQEIERQSLAGKRSPTAAGFELVELGRCLLDVRNVDGAKLAWPSVIDRGLEALNGSLARVVERHDALRAPQSSFRRYAQTVIGWPGSGR